MRTAARRILLGLSITVLVAIVLGTGLTNPTRGWTTRKPVLVRRTGRLADPRAVESSGVVRGRINPSVLWTINDSGNEPLIFGFDTTGASRSTLRLTNAPNIDWEAISSGPCGATWCLYLGDIGDNRGVRPSVAIYRVVEPPLGPRPEELSLSTLDQVTAHYPDGPHDAESLVVSGDGGIGILTKGREGWVGEYWIGPAAWGKGSVTMEALGRLPVPSAFLFGHLVTDAALDPTGNLLAVRTYRTIYLFDRADAPTRLPDRPRVACPIRGLDPIGEGLAWWDDSTLIMTSEQGLSSKPAPITALQCPLQ